MRVMGHMRHWPWWLGKPFTSPSLICFFTVNLHKHMPGKKRRFQASVVCRNSDRMRETGA